MKLKNILRRISSEEKLYRYQLANNISISAEDSVDGLEHEVHSIDDWRQYYRLNEVDMSLVSPIFPREIKD